MRVPRSPFVPLIAIAIAIAACSPTLDWREFTPQGSGIGVSFPCRPDRQARTVALAGASVRMEMLACSAGDMTFALAYADVADPTRVGPSLVALRETAAGNLGATPKPGFMFAVKGMTPNANATRLDLAGRLPDGSTVREQAAFFSHGARVYQASVIGSDPAPAAVENFLAALRFPS